MLGELMETGEGTSADQGPDICMAIKYYKRAVSQGNARAMYNLGNIYETGNESQADLKPDLKLAIKLYTEVTNLNLIVG
jgi:TPR repeat protein